MIIAVDFDGTCVTHEYPLVGKEIGAPRVLKRLVEEDHRLLLFTMRCDSHLKEAVQWFANNNIELYGVNENPSQKEWTTSPKCYANLYIDDAALGIPLISNPELSSRPFVHWLEIEDMLTKLDILKRLN